MITRPSIDMVIYKKDSPSFAFSNLFNSTRDQIYITKYTCVCLCMNEKCKHHYVSLSFLKSNAGLTWISNFQPLTASSVRILVKDIVSPSRKNRWHASLLTSRPKEKGKTLMHTKYLSGRLMMSNYTIKGNKQWLTSHWQLTKAN